MIRYLKVREPLLASTAVPRTARAIESFPCLGNWMCADDEVCKLLCEKLAVRKKAASPPQIEIYPVVDVLRP